MNREGQAGLSLVEVLVSTAVFAFIALSVMTMVTTSLHLNKLGQERTTATSIATQRVQQITAMPFQTAANFARYALPEETVVTGPPRQFTSGYGDIPGYPELRRVVELSYDTPETGLLKIDVTVFWQHVNQQERSHTMIEFVHPDLD